MSNRLQRSPHLIAFWRDDGFHVRDYSTGRECAVDRLGIALLERAGRPVAREELADGDHGAAVDQLVEAGLLVPEKQVRAAATTLGDWQSWCPEAAVFHFGTKDHPFRAPSQRLVVIGPRTPPPPLKKDPPGAERTCLPPFLRDGELAAALLQRRTWRQFSPKAISHQQLADLLGLTWAVQAWGRGIEDPRLAFKTSPSGGGKHSIEVYVAALRVDGLDPGTYHYCPDRHALAPVADRPDGDELLTFLPTQEYFTDAAALFFMTSVFERVQSKYKFPRAYRVVTLEAGHLAQTFCLVATRLGLAPFTTAALGDSAIERHLGIDGVRESILYVTGVGQRPDGLDWAPFGDDRKVPKLMPPAHRQDEDD